MPQPALYQPAEIKPLSGPMDTRSTPDAVAVGSWRFRQNIMVADQGKACRRPGWPKYRYEREIYNNEDLHDQLLELQTYYDDRPVPYDPQSDITVYPPGVDAGGLPYCGATEKTRAAGRQPITFLFDALSTVGNRVLLAATQNRIYEMEEGKGNWQIISDRYGGEPGNGLHRRWSGAQVNDVVVLTNNFDPVLARTLGSPIQGCGMQGAQPIESLAGIGLTKAAVVCAWKGTIFLADVEMDGERIEYRVVWSRFKLPLNFTPGTAGGNGTAGTQDLPYGGRILAMVPLDNVLLIYTTKGIWMCESVGGDQVFNFTERYAEPKNGEGCLAYRNTIVSTGKAHLYCGRDGIYTYSLFLPAPERTEWIHKSDSQVFNTLDQAACDLHVGTFYPASKEYWLSWVQVGESLPSRTLNLNTLYQSSDFIDAGFAAFCNHAPDDRGTLLDWLLINGLCTPEELAAQADVITIGVKEGGYCDPAEAPTNPPVIPNRNIPIWTNQPLDMDGRLIEDYTKATPDQESLCTLLGDTTLEDLCQECAQGGLLIMASADDYCLKQYSADGGVYYREVSLATTACGEWRRDGYTTILRTGAQDYGMPKEDKDQRALNLEYESTGVDVIPSALQMKIGYSSVAVDSNNDASGRCALVWRPLKPKTLKCLNLRSGYDQVQAGTRPNLAMDWNFLYTGRYFYFEMAIEGLNGAVCFSRLTADVRQALRSVTS